MDYKNTLFQMLRIRRIEERIAEEYTKQEMRCPVHLSIGQEAIAVGVCKALRSNDIIFSNHRAHAHYLAKGGNLKSFIAELYGKKTGCCEGKGGSMHIIDLSVNMLGAISIVAGSIPIAVGTAFGSFLKNENKITCVFLGDGATEEGVFFECLNFASLKNLPILFVCENNFLAVTTPLNQRQSNNRDLIKIVQGHGILAKKENGNDIEKVYQLSKQAMDYMINEKKPMFLEFETYRFRAHCGPEYDYHLGYRTKKEVLEKEKKCPVEIFKTKLIKQNIINDLEIKQMEDKIENEITEAFQFAKNSPFPSKEEALTGVYKKEVNYETN
ncbi:MAG: Acetoin:2,6-dichlorophenolindophenol oxidoreductase subunit alpha [Candidatus Anoxychlamydiales bacterium]|nr:Acetoin:2,6-dichlorophenolindophenol oxidoreductase subunit alpha [Candidatus Anoxychlamydiales bacterium]